MTGPIGLGSWVMHPEHGVGQVWDMHGAGGREELEVRLDADVVLLATGTALHYVRLGALSLTDEESLGTRYLLTQRARQTQDGVDTGLPPQYESMPGDPEEAWKRRVEQLREQRLQRASDDLQSIEAGHADGIWWIEFSDQFAARSLVDGKHTLIVTSTRLEYEALS